MKGICLNNYREKVIYLSMIINQECLICYSPMSIDIIIRLENCGHFFCRDCARKWLHTNLSCPLDRRSVTSLTVINGSREDMIQVGHFIELSNSIAEINSYIFHLPSIFCQNIFLPDFHLVNEETSEEELTRIIGDFSIKHMLMHDLATNIFMVNSRFAVNVHDISNLIKAYDLNNVSTNCLLGHEFLKHYYFSNISRFRKVDIFPLSEKVIDLLRNKKINRAQIIDFFQKLSERLDRLNAQYNQSVELFRWLIIRLFGVFNEFVLRFYRNLVIEYNPADFALSGIYRKNSDVTDRIALIKILILESSDDKTENGKSSKGFRIEKDSIGEIKVPISAYYGSQTERSKKNFEVAVDTDKMPELVIKSLILLKISAAEANLKLGCLTNKDCASIVAAGDTCLSDFNTWKQHFPLVVWQTGSGTQSNMNVNEVLSNLANKSLGFELGSKNPIHPNDHVNMSQSSNDTFPTAMNIATVVALTNQLIPALKDLRAGISAKEVEFAKVIKIGRTHMQDAVPLTVGQELSSYVNQLDYSLDKITKTVKIVAKHLAIGGTAVGTGLGTVAGFDVEVCKRLKDNVKKYLNVNVDFGPAQNKFSALAAHDSLMTVAGDLNTLATALMKIANDFRLLGSGPRCGIGEFLLPENEPGSSIMPGKVNPTQCESLSMVCAQVMGNYVAISIGSSQGHLELNVYKPLIIRNVLHSIQMLADSSKCFVKYCVEGLNLNLTQINTYVNQSLMLVTALSPFIGYDKSAQIAKYSHKNNCSLKEAALKLKLVSEEDFDKWLDPSKMLSPK